MTLLQMSIWIYITFNDIEWASKNKQPVLLNNRYFFRKYSVVSTSFWHPWSSNDIKTILLVGKNISNFEHVASKLKLFWHQTVVKSIMISRRKEKLTMDSKEFLFISVFYCLKEIENPFKKNNSTFSRIFSEMFFLELGF